MGHGVLTGGCSCRKTWPAAGSVYHDGHSCAKDSFPSQHEWLHPKCRSALTPSGVAPPSRYQERASSSHQGASTALSGVPQLLLPIPRTARASTIVAELLPETGQKPHVAIGSWACVITRGRSRTLTGKCVDHQASMTQGHAGQQSRLCETRSPFHCVNSRVGKEWVIKQNFKISPAHHMKQSECDA